jgi:hypothetical protein
MYKIYEIVKLLVSFCRFDYMFRCEKLLFVFLYHWHFGGLWTTFLQIIMNKFNAMNFHHLFYKTCTLTHTSNTIHKAWARPPDEKDTFLNDRPWLFTVNWSFKNKNENKKKMFSLFLFLFLELQETVDAYS